MTTSLARKVEGRCRLAGEFRLRSGQVSGEYFDKYLFEAEPELLREVAEAMVELLPRCEVLAGMELGGIPIATVMSQLTGLPTVFVRKRAKEYGTCKRIEGDSVEGRAVVAVEDVVTTGGALLGAVAELRAAGANVVAAVCAIDREQGGRERLLAEGIPLHAAIPAGELDG